MTGVSKERQTIGSMLSGFKERLPFPTQRAISRINKGEDIGSLRESHGRKILSFLRELSRPLSTQEKDFSRSIIEEVVPKPLEHYNMFSYALDEGLIRLALSVIRERQEEFGATNIEALEKDTELRIGIAKFCSLRLLYATAYGDRRESRPDWIVWEILDSRERFHPSRDRGELYKTLFKVWRDSAQEQKDQAITELDQELALTDRHQSEQREAVERAQSTGVYIPDRALYSSGADLRNELTELSHAKRFFLLSDDDLIKIARSPSEDEIRKITHKYP